MDERRLRTGVEASSSDIVLARIMEHVVHGDNEVSRRVIEIDSMNGERTWLQAPFADRTAKATALSLP